MKSLKPHVLRPHNYFGLNKRLLKIFGIALDGNPSLVYWTVSFVGWFLLVVFQVTQFYSMACMAIEKQTRKLVDLIHYQSNLGASKFLLFTTYYCLCIVFNLQYAEFCIISRL